jgi:hypothetical protein
MPDEALLAKGFLMHKMYHYGYVCKKSSHGKHTSALNLPKSCPLELRRFLNEAIDELKSEGLLITWPTNYGEQACVVANDKGYELANAFQRHAKLPVVEYEKPPPAKVPPLSLEELKALKFPKEEEQRNLSQG